MEKDVIGEFLSVAQTWARRDSGLCRALRAGCGLRSSLRGCFLLVKVSSVIARSAQRAQLVKVDGKYRGYVIVFVVFNVLVGGVLESFLSRPAGVFEAAEIKVGRCCQHCGVFSAAVP